MEELAPGNLSKMEATHKGQLLPLGVIFFPVRVAPPMRRETNISMSQIISLGGVSNPFNGYIAKKEH